MEHRDTGAALIGSKYRLERRILAQDGVTVWEATDITDGRSVRLSVYERGSAMLDHGTVGDGVYVVTAAPPRFASAAAPHLELVPISDEDAFFEDPPPPELFDVYERPRSRGWIAAAAVAMCAAIGAGGYYVARSHARPIATSETTVTAAEMPTPTTTTATTTELPPPVAAPIEIDNVTPTVTAAPVHHDAPPPVAKPVVRHHAPKRTIETPPKPVVETAPAETTTAAPSSPAPLPQSDDPLTL